MERIATITDFKSEEEFYRKYKYLARSVISKIIRSIGTEEDIEECINDTLYEVISNYNKYDEKRGSLENYICLIARSKALNLRNKLSKNMHISFDNDILITIRSNEYIDDILIADIISNVLEKLKSEERKLFTLKYIYEYNTKEISQFLKISVTNTKVRIHRLKGKVTKLLSEHGINV